MTYEFEGRTEKEAIENAMLELGIDRDSFDVEILEVHRGGLFKKGCVKIRLHTDEPSLYKDSGVPKTDKKPVNDQSYDNDAIEHTIVEFLSVTLEKMGTPSQVSVQSRERKKLALNIETKDSAIVIGKKGRTLDALQLITTMYARKTNKLELRVLLDCENYRLHHEEALVRMALSVSAKVRLSHRSILLDPMNPYDRRVIHTTLDKSTDIDTKSEGDGMYKQIRVSYKNH